MGEGEGEGDRDHPFVPDGFEPPTTLDLPSFRLRPLGPEHNERDHAAWMGSVEHIRSTPGFPWGDWPTAMSLDANLADLRMHRSDFDDRTGFTYTVLSPDGPEETADVIGCVYLYPDRDHPGGVLARSWVTAAHARLDAPLASAIRVWLEGPAWPWEPDRIRDHPRSTAPPDR